MPGAPESAALSEVRLVGASCANLQAAATRQAQARIQQMNREVDAELRDWRAAQSQCWCDAHPQRCYGPNVLDKLEMQTLGALSGGRGGSLAGIGSAGGAGVGSGAGVAQATRPPPRARSASGTNNQVSGVDEADIVKNDGRYVYLAINGALRIVEALNPRVLSVTKLPGIVRELFVQGDRAVVYVAIGGNGQKRCTYGYDCVFSGDGSGTKIMIFDVSNRAAPALVRSIDLSGSLLAARRIGNAIHTVVSDGNDDGPRYSTSPDDLEMCSTPAGKVQAEFAALKRRNAKLILATTSFPVIREASGERILCDNVLRAPLGDGQAYTSVISFDLQDDQAPAVTETLQSRPGAVFASGDALYLSVVHHRASRNARWYSFYHGVDEVSDVHKFRIGERAEDTSYMGSGVVPGRVLNQFSMDEYYGYLRIATTRGRVPDPKVQSAVSILAQGPGGNLMRVGAVEGIAPGEDIRAVRFDEDRGYVVTFKKTDPLFVLDLYQPAHPSIIGELKIPGFSTYIHRIDPNHLLSIGLDANDHDSFAFFDGVILQLFDVTNPTEPQLLHKEKIGTRGSSSEALTDHLAFNYFADKGLLAIPMTLCEGGGDGTFGDKLTFSGLLVYRLSVATGFSKLGGIDHGAQGVNCRTWWSRANSAVKRSIFLDDLVYSIADDRVKVQRLDHLGTDVADIALTP
jgi:hypothetical protein